MQELTALLLLASAMTFTPGPNTMLSTALAAQWGLRGSLAFVCAVPVGWVCLMLACGLGLGGLLMAAPALRWVVKVGGAAALFWLAWKLARAHAQQLRVNTMPILHVGFWQGVALQFVNIKAWTLALAVTAGWVAPGNSLLAVIWQPSLWIAMAVMAVFAFASNLSYAVVGSLLRQWLLQGRRLVVFNRLMAALLVATALWMVAL
jgi:threonine/homoserine/homoserine lactone efflux protein